MAEATQPYTDDILGIRDSCEDDNPRAGCIGHLGDMDRPMIWMLTYTHVVAHSL